jgi:anti-anti-sigma factor
MDRRNLSYAAPAVHGDSLGHILRAVGGNKVQWPRLPGRRSAFAGPRAEEQHPEARCPVSETPVATPVTIEKVGGAIVARPQVKLMDAAVIKALKLSVAEAAGDGADTPLVVVDLSRVAILPSLALGGLLEIANACKARGQTLKLAGLQPQIRKVLSVTRLDTLFPIADTVEAAVG